MPKPTCIIIDSPGHLLQMLENYLAASPVIILNNKFSLIKDAEEYCKYNRVDLIIGNIDIIEKDFIEALKDAQPSCLLICAGNREVIENKGFEENIFGYIYKPFSYERILSMISNASMYISYNTKYTNESRKTYVFIKSEYKTIRVDLEDILYCEGLKDYSQIYLRGKAKPLVTLQNLKSLFEKLPAKDFVRVHRSFIVSMDKIDAISRNEIAIGNFEIPIGDAYRERLYELIDVNS